MPKYCGVDGVVHEIKESYCGVDGVVHEIKESYCGVDGVVVQTFSSEQPYLARLRYTFDGTYYNYYVEVLDLELNLINTSPTFKSTTLVNRGCVNKITFGNGTIAAAITNGTAIRVIYSNDLGATWNYTDTAGYYLSQGNIAYGNGMWILYCAARQSMRPAYYTSTDLKTWTERNLSYNGYNQYMVSLTYADGKWVAGTCYYILDDDYIGGLFTSADGINWTLGQSFGSDVFSIRYAKGLYVASVHNNVANTDFVYYGTIGSMVSISVAANSFPDYLSSCDGAIYGIGETFTKDGTTYYYQPKVYKFNTSTNTFDDLGILISDSTSIVGNRYYLPIVGYDDTFYSCQYHNKLYYIQTSTNPQNGWITLSSNAGTMELGYCLTVNGGENNLDTTNK